MRTDLIRRALLGGIAAFVLITSPLHLDSATAQNPLPEGAPEPTAPDEEPAEPPVPDEEQPDTTSVDSEEPAPEPGDVAPAVWVGVIALVVVAAVWAIRRSTSSSSSQEP